MSQPTLLTMTAPLREDFVVPYHDIGDRTQEPTVALVAGIHGNELNGIFVLARLSAFLRGVEAGDYPGITLRRRVVVIPAVNVLGVNTRSRAWPFDGTDINRMFPGYDAGETSQRIAHHVLNATRSARYRVDIHSSNRDFEELLQVRLYDPSDRERETARLFRVGCVIERALNPILTTTLLYAWRGLRGENFVIQVGRAGVLEPAQCEDLFRGLVQFLGATGVLDGVHVADDLDTHHFSKNHTLPVLSDNAGFFVSRLDVGRWLQAGDLIGQVYDGFDGNPRREVRAPVAGLLSGLRRAPLLFEGDLVARIQTRQPVEGDLESHLYSQGQ